MANMTNLIMIVVVVALAIIFLPKIMPQLKGVLGGATQTQTQTGNGGSSTSRSTCKNGDCDIDVSGNGCACANGVCKGNCSDMEKIDLENFDPLEYVEQHV